MRKIGLVTTTARRDKSQNTSAAARPGAKAEFLSANAPPKSFAATFIAPARLPSSVTCRTSGIGFNIEESSPARFLLDRSNMENKAPCIAIERHVLRLDAAETLRKALDASYRRFRDTARQNWERHFAKFQDPSDSCVTVRCSGFLPPAQTSSNFSLPRFGQ
jgi:hypothetical protein